MAKKALDQKEINKIATQYKKLRKKAENSKDPNIQKEYKNFQNFFIKKLTYLVRMKTYKYKKFSNYYDLQQVGFEALLSATKTYNENKGFFTPWAKRYIGTRVSRAANAHSTIRYPIAKAKEMKPYKTSCIPVMIDESADPFETVEDVQNKERIVEAIKALPDELQFVINMTYGTLGARSKPMSHLMKDMGISRQQYLKLLNEAKEQIKKQLNDYV